MSDYVKVLERFVSEHKCGFVVAAIRAALEENEQLRTSLVEHFQREHIDGDGPEIDRWKARSDAALNLLTHTEDASDPWGAIHRAEKVLRGEK